MTVSHQMLVWRIKYLKGSNNYKFSICIFSATLPTLNRPRQVLQGLSSNQNAASFQFHKKVKVYHIVGLFSFGSTSISFSFFTSRWAIPLYLVFLAFKVTWKLVNNNNKKWFHSGTPTSPYTQFSIFCQYQFFIRFC